MPYKSYLRVVEVAEVVVTLEVVVVLVVGSGKTKNVQPIMPIL